jgi:hypothetical protein
MFTMHAGLHRGLLTDFVSALIASPTADQSSLSGPGSGTALRERNRPGGL